MKDKKEYDQWFSTYGLITAERILESYQIKLKPETMIKLIKKTDSFHHLVIIIPSINLFNGIIRDQARDYQTYAQKKLIDYLLSGQANEDTTGPGENVRKQLESIRQELVTIGEAFDEADSKHRQLIKTSQDALREANQWWNDLVVAVLSQCQKVAKTNQIELTPFHLRAIKDRIHSQAGLNEDIALGDFCQSVELGFSHDAIKQLNLLSIDSSKAYQQVRVINEAFRVNGRENTRDFIRFRNQFRQKIINIKELITQLMTSGYKEDMEKDEENRQALNFYQQLGDE